jgi:hypothetical protein
MFARSVFPLLAAVALIHQYAGSQPQAKVEWTTDVTKMKIPNAPVSGHIGGRKFKADRVEYRSSLTQLTLRQGKDFFADDELSIFLFLKKDESPFGKTFVFGPKEAAMLRAPHIYKSQRHSKDKAPKTTDFLDGGYALKLEFGKAKEGRVPGKIYVCLPDKEKSVIAGTFEAIIK